MENLISAAVQQHLAALDSLRENLPEIRKIARLVTKILKRGGSVFLCGNGGSAADSQHIAAELVGRFKKDRKALAAAALTTDTSVLTSLGNDYGFEKIFERQVEALAKKGDVLIAISTSGNSPNALNAVKKARLMKVHTVGLLGGDGGKIKKFCDIPVVIGSDNTARIQEMHIFAGHILCELIEDSF
ncbi:MAG: D-sedoheptulose 7-phosphate isomerase [Elusimicrobia bacterium]|nr:D-sedoheptulose 7-phosphate isomerase [Elusimicrobiota bacterium]